MSNKARKEVRRANIKAHKARRHVRREGTKVHESRKVRMRLKHVSHEDAEGT